MDRLESFLESDKQAKKAKFVAFVAAVSALFLNIAPPLNTEAKSALVAIQLFWLVLLTVSLTSIFVSFVKYLWTKEKDLEKRYNLPATFVFSAAAGVVLASVVLNLWRYIISLYADTLAVFSVLMGFPGGLTIGSFLIFLFVEKRKGKIALIWRILVTSMVLAALISTAGLYLQEGITQKFFLIWYTLIFPNTFISIAAASTAFMLYKKEKLF